MQTIAILQRFRPDDLFTAAQQQRLRELMDQFQAALTSGRSETIAQGTELAPTLQSELDTLVEAELEANIQRSQRLLQQSNRLLCTEI
jgi:Tfp pilus assembly protein FimT